MPPETCRYGHENYEILRDSGDVGDKRVMDVRCRDCGSILGVVESIHEQRVRSFHYLPAVYLKREHHIPCGCVVNCGGFWCRKVA